MGSAQFAIGIDLGTTNTALGAVRLDDDVSVPGALPVPQVVAAHETLALPLLPSFLYQPASSELPDGALALPWDAQRTFAVGAFAVGGRVDQRGAEEFTRHDDVAN